MTFATVCSGIEAPSLAWTPLGWKALFFAEIEKAACRVLAHHYPTVPNLGDMTKINGRDWRGRVDVFFGGTPCQAFSLAGLRKSLEDDRGNLTLRFAELVHEIEPEFVIWENVPGVLSTSDNAFGCFLAGLVGADAPLRSPYERGRWSHAGMVAGPARTAAWRILNAEHFGMAQCRYRVFVVSGHAGDFRPAQILFESASLRRDTPPRRKKGEGVAGTTGGGSSSRGRNGGGDTSGGPAGDECQNLIAVDSREFIPNATNCLAFANSGYQAGAAKAVDIGATVTGRPQDLPVIVTAFKQRPEGDVLISDKAYTVSTSSNASGANTPKVMTIQDQGGNIALDVAVRRLAPREVERLFGMPDDYTLVPGIADNARYRVLGNSVVVPVLAWIGQRIAAVISKARMV